MDTPSAPAATKITATVTAPNGGVYRIEYERPGPVTDDDVRTDLADLATDLDECAMEIVTA